MPYPSLAILDRFRARYGQDIDLTLRPAYRDLLHRLGDPHRKLPPVFHVAGTNGKGSTCAFLRAMLEAAGNRVHVYTSPHLVTFHERIRVAGQLIGEDELAEILGACERLAIPGGVSYFEAATTAAFVAFARHPADAVILETGLGGRLDATNIVDRKLATIITRLSFDHREYLGDTITKIAGEKAGIMRPRTPCFAAAQPDPAAMQVLRNAAAALDAPLVVAGEAWRITVGNNGFRFEDATRHDDLPPPALAGRHQYDNAALAIAALSTWKQSLPRDAIAQGLRQVEWPARLQRLTTGRLAGLLPPQAELWLDGGHNDSAGEVLAAQMAAWQRQDGADYRPLYVILGMLTTKRPAEFLSPFADAIAGLQTVPVPGEPLAFAADALADAARQVGIADVTVAADVAQALGQIPPDTPPCRVLICGSLYLAGAVLTAN